MKKDFFQSITDLNVLIVGDVMVDRYLTGEVHRISPEAPVPIVLSDHTEDRLGGAANVALNVAALGATPYLCSMIGKDQNGEGLLQTLEKQGISSTNIRQSSARRTTVKTRVIANNQQIVRVDTEDAYPLSEVEENELIAHLHHIIDTQHIDVILFQDYNKGVLTKQIIRTTLTLAKTNNIPTAVDPKKDNIWAYRGVTLFKPNLKEVRESVPFQVAATLPDLLLAQQYIYDKLKPTYTLITLSEKGLFLGDVAGKGTLYPTQARSVVDVCGAGDSVIAVTACALASELPLTELALLANLAGGQVCEKAGVVAIDCEQLEQEFHTHRVLS